MRAITSPLCLIVALGEVGVLAVAGCGATSSSSSSGSSTTASAGSGGGGGATQWGGGEPISGAPKAIEGMPEPNEGVEEWGQSSSNECVYEGPGNFSVDVSKCPSNWNINRRITEDSINMFTSAP